MRLTGLLGHLVALDANPELKRCRCVCACVCVCSYMYKERTATARSGPSVFLSLTQLRAFLFNLDPALSLLASAQTDSTFGSRVSLPSSLPASSWKAI